MSSDLPQCDDDVYQKGEVVFITHSISSAAVERWVVLVRWLSGEQVDWHWFGGRAVIKAMGDLSRVRRSLKLLRVAHDYAYRLEWETSRVYRGGRDIDDAIDGIWRYNAESWGL